MFTKLIIINKKKISLFIMTIYAFPTILFSCISNCVYYVFSATSSTSNIGTQTPFQPSLSASQSSVARDIASTLISTSDLLAVLAE